MNPARSLAPALFTGGKALASLLLYLVALPIGAVLAALCYETLPDGQKHAQPAPADLDSDEPGAGTDLAKGGQITAYNLG